MKKINAIAKKYKLKVIEDAAQAICSKYAGKFIGNSQNITCFSLHPTKNLGVLGDGGFITTNSNKIYKKLCLLRNHGLEKEELKLVGRNSRLDDTDSLIGLIRLRYIKKDTNRKLKIAKLYDKFLNGLVKTPYLGCCENIKHTYHRYVIRAKKRDMLFNFLRKKGIDVKIHYKKNIHEQEYYKNYLTKKTKLRITTNISKEIMSLPCSHFMRDAEVFKVIDSIKEFFLNQNYKF
jgi:dTDP-4-amino-4,6-dideoxygalactose transaminase